jgi:hypothetical protein
MLNSDQLTEYLRLNCQTDVFWLTTVGRSGLQLLPAGFLEGRRLCRLHVVRSRVVGSTVHPAGVRVPDSCLFLRGAETRTLTSPILEEDLTDDDFLVVDDRAAVRLVFDDHNRFVFAHAGLELLDRYRFIRDTWWPIAERTSHPLAAR